HGRGPDRAGRDADRRQGRGRDPRAPASRGRGRVPPDGHPLEARGGRERPPDRGLAPRERHQGGARRDPDGSGSRHRRGGAADGPRGAEAGRGSRGGAGARGHRSEEGGGGRRGGRQGSQGRQRGRKVQGERGRQARLTSRRSSWVSAIPAPRTRERVTTPASWRWISSRRGSGASRDGGATESSCAGKGARGGTWSTW